MKLPPSRFKPTLATKELMVAPSPEAGRCGRFIDFQRWVLAQGQSQLPIQTLLVACLVAFDGAWSHAELINALKGSYAWRDLEDHVAASWMQGRILQRRMLSPFTALCWRAITRTDYDWEQELKRLAMAYQQYTRLNPVLADCVEGLLTRGRHWASLVLPPLLSAQLEGVLTLTAVPDSVWIRRNGDVGSVRTRAPEIAASEDHDDILYQSAAEGKCRTEAWFLEKLKATFIDCVGPGVNLSNDRARRKLTENLAQLNSELVHAGVPGLLLFGWVQDLLIHGSARVSAPAIQTLRNYIHVAGPALLRGMNATVDVMALEVDGWKAMYEAAQLLCSEGQIRILNPALASFHRFLIRTLDVDPIFGAIFAGDEALPVASVIWPHAFDAAHQFLLCAPVEERLQSQSVVMITLLRHSSLRRAEICTLRLSSLWFFDGGVILEVSPKRSHKSNKSKAARRRIVVRDKTACDTLRHWASRRRSEAALKGDLLFADPHRSDLLYQMGATYALVSKALKDATRDPDVGWHTCRHTFASNRLVTALMSREALAISPLHRLQKSMGHASLITTLQTYCHTYEVPLRAHLDAAFAQVVTSKHLEIWTGEAATTIRQRKRRTFVKGVAYLAMAFGCKDRKLESEAPIAVGSVGPDRIQSSSVLDQLTPLRTLRILADIKNGMSVAGICSANSLSEHLLDRVCSVILPGEGCSRGDLESQIREASEQLSELDFSRLGQPRWLQVLISLQAQTVEQGRMLATAWTKHGGLHGLSMVAPEEVSPVLRLLAKSGFLASQMRLRLAHPASTSPTVRSRLERDESIRLTVADVFGAWVLTEQVKPRGGRPDAYLVPLNSVSSCTPAPPATVDAKSLHSVMYAFSIYAGLEMSFE